MAIKIAQRLSPYSHEIGSLCLLPRTSLRLQIFPALVRIHDLSHAVPKLIHEMPLNVQGPVKNFTVQQNLEREEVKAWGQAQNGFFRYRLAAGSQDNSFSFTVEKEPNHPLTLAPLPPDQLSPQRLSYEWLSLGSHKAQDWTLMRRREALEEILPIWFRLGQQVPEKPYDPTQGTAMLLARCEERIASRAHEQILPAFVDLFRAGFEGMLSPRLADDQHQGYSLPPLSQDKTSSPLELLRRGSQLIRSLFIQSHPEGVSILPLLPSAFAFGRMLHLSCQGLGLIDLEWSKKTIRRVIIHADTDREVLFHFQAGLKSFRLRNSDGSLTSLIPCGSSFPIKKENLYFLDNFRR
jgi:hypothetical protein